MSVEIFKKSGELKASLPSQLVRAEVTKLVREMNSYYSNLIEGHNTHPVFRYVLRRRGISPEPVGHRSER